MDTLLDYHVSCDTWFMTLPKRFSVYDNFIYYDINDPLGNDVKKLEPNSFDFILADPPFWLEEVLLKLFQTIDHLKTHNGKTMICAGPPMTSFLVSSSGSGLSGPRRSRRPGFTISLLPS